VTKSATKNGSQLSKPSNGGATVALTKGKYKQQIIKLAGKPAIAGNVQEK
jgi:hypothetical protein